MGWNDHLEDNNFNYVQKCPKCGKKFKVYEEEQVPGFRFPDPMICPYCNHVICKSMEVEFFTYKIEEDK